MLFSCIFIVLDQTNFIFITKFKKESATNMDSTKFGDFISPFEAEYLVKEIKLQEIEEYGSPK